MNVYQALWATRFLPRFAGAAPYHLSRTNLKFSRFGQVWSLFHLTVSATTFCLYPGELISNSSHMRPAIKTMSTCLQCLTATYSVLKDGFCQQAMIDVVESIDQYDEKTGYNNEVSGKQENERVRMWSFVYTGVLIILAIGRYLAWKGLKLNPTSEIFLMQIDNSINMFVVSTFVLGLRVRHLNSMVEQDRHVKVQSSGSETVANTEYVRELYARLVESGDRLNDHYAGRLFLWLALILIVTITRYHYMLAIEMPMVICAAMFIELLPSILGVLLVLLACEFTTVQINRTPVVLLEKSIRCTALIDRGRKEIFTLSLYMGLQPFEFSGLGFFSVDLKLLYAIVATTITYLTLGLQSNIISIAD